MTVRFSNQLVPELYQPFWELLAVESTVVVDEGVTT